MFTVCYEAWSLSLVEREEHLKLCMYFTLACVRGTPTKPVLARRLILAMTEGGSGTCKISLEWQWQMQDEQEYSRSQASRNPAGTFGRTTTFLPPWWCCCRTI